jgi:hypothetical protein
MPPLPWAEKERKTTKQGARKRRGSFCHKVFERFSITAMGKVRVRMEEEAEKEDLEEQRI